MPFLPPNQQRQSNEALFTFSAIHTHMFNSLFFRDYPGKPVPESAIHTGTLKMRDMNLRDMKMRHHVAGVENARHEFAAPTCKGGYD